ncbi:MAG: SGNH/GDSL hydrolase family protein [Candidatus Latescibacterota bacterium]|jgi:hypothetical protein
MPTIPATDTRLTWSGTTSLENGDGWVKPWRIPYQDQDLYSPGVSELASRAEMPSGVRIRFASNATTLTLHTEPLVEEGKFDLYADGTLVSITPFSAGQTATHFTDLPSGDKVLELWLSQAMTVAVRSLEIPDNSDISHSEDTRLKWITYGSSISHCRNAGSPSCTWPGVVARGKDFNLTSFGFGGQCHADPMMARLIRDREADFLSIKIGINIYGGSSLGPRTFRPAIIGTIATIREGHPTTPFAVCSPIWGHDREDTPNTVGLTLQQMRFEIQEAVASFQKRGDANLYYIDGLKLFNQDLAHHLPDNLHPDAEGYRRMGENFLREAFELQEIKVG